MKFMNIAMVVVMAVMVAVIGIEKHQKSETTKAFQEKRMDQYILRMVSIMWESDSDSHARTEMLYLCSKLIDDKILEKKDKDILLDEAIADVRKIEDRITRSEYFDQLIKAETSHHAEMIAIEKIMKNISHDSRLSRESRYEMFLTALEVKNEIKPATF